MDWLMSLVDFALHVDRHLEAFVRAYDMWVYVLLFAIIFAETGVVIMPFLPGDSLLFALGTLAATQKLDLTVLLVSLSVAAIVGDSANYWLGTILGPKIFRGENVR